jgi:hypothetical protein
MNYKLACSGIELARWEHGTLDDSSRDSCTFYLTPAPGLVKINEDTKW